MVTPMATRNLRICSFLLIGCWAFIACHGFAPLNRIAVRSSTIRRSSFYPPPSSSSLLQQRPDGLDCASSSPPPPTSEEDDCRRHKRKGSLQKWRFWRRFDTIQSAGFSHDEVRVSGVFRRIKDLHNPITYLALGLFTGFKLEWPFRSPYYWFVMGFCVKWYRARYVFKIPVWDRQPNWNNIITSKEQEKDLKAFTCKKCGSTIFIAKTREFFFEGDTGIGGLGCFSCGAKGKENFVMDRDRIVEDVADMDDYFEYERPLDFVDRAERRKLLKEAGGDEEKANQMLVDKSGGEIATAPVETSEDDSSNDQLVVEEDSGGEEVVSGSDQEDATVVAPVETSEDGSSSDQLVVEEEGGSSVEEVVSESDQEVSAVVPEPEEVQEIPPVVEEESPAEPAAAPSSPPSEDINMDILDMDDF